MISFEKIKKLTQENKKLILYKVSEIYSDDDELLNFMDSLEWEDIDVVFDIVFAWNEGERNTKWIKENEKINKLIWEISELNNKVNKLIISQKEFIDAGKDNARLKEIENMFKL